jgi:hypothetical protein
MRKDAKSEKLGLSALSWYLEFGIWSFYKVDALSLDSCMVGEFSLGFAHAETSMA